MSPMRDHAPSKHPVRRERASRCRGWRRGAAGALLLPLLAALVLGAGACTSSDPEQVQEASEEIRATLMEYLPKMAEAYRTGNVEPLEPYTTQKERAILKKSIREHRAAGREMDTELLELTVEDLNLQRGRKAYVITAELWAVTTYAVGTEQVLGQDPRQASRVRYQLNKVDGDWIIYNRHRDPALNP